MEKIINDFNIGLFLLQTFIFALLIAILYFVIKLYKKVTRYLNNKSKKTS